jgi:membrane protease YdiL (CAAX protease family)
MKIIKTILLIILYALIYYIFQYIIGAIGGALAVIIGTINSGGRNSYEIYMNYMNGGIGTTLCITIILSAIISYLIYWGIFLIRKQKITRVCNFKKIKLSYIPASFILGISICFLNSSFVILLSKIDFFKYQIQKYQIINRWLSETNTVLLVLALVITAPLIEEILFRGMIFNELKQIMPVVSALIIQGLFFGIYHLNIVQFIYCSFLGIMFGLLYNWTQNLWVPVILHFTNNLLAVVAMKQPVTESPDNPNFFVFLISLIITVLLCLYFFKRREKPDNRENVLS